MTKNNVREKSYFELFKEKFSGKDNYGNLKQNYIDKVRKMPKQNLIAETKQMIWLSAYANNNPRSDYHWQCDACYAICEEVEKGLYGKLHEQVVKENT